MEFLEQVADNLAKEALEVEGVTGDDNLINDIMKTIGSSSTTLEEAFLTAVRIRRAESRALDVLAKKKAAHKV